MSTSNRTNRRGEAGQATWKVGELAKRTELSVRALHHYEEIGLIEPPDRAASGYRLYSVGDIARLQQIKSLRQLGFSLDEVRDLMGRPDFSPQRVVEAHLKRLREQIKLQHRLCERLETMAARLRSSETVSVEEFIETIEEMNMIEKYYTAEQMQELKVRRGNLGEDRIRQVEEEWPRLIAQVRAEMDKGADPASEPMQRLAKRWVGLVREFTGGNPGIEKSLRNMYHQEPTAAARSGLDQGIFDYVSKAMAALKNPD